MTDGYRVALDKAWKALAARSLEVQAGNAGGRAEDGRIVIEVLGRRCTVDASERLVYMGGEVAGVVGSVLVLHYLTNAIGVMPSGRLVSYRQLPGGDVYYPAFRSRVVDVIGGTYDRDPAGVIAALGSMNAERRAGGGNAFVVPAFPRLPVTIVLWRGDDEVPGAAGVLFDETAPLFLPTEDLAEAGCMIADSLRPQRPAV